MIPGSKNKNRNAEKGRETSLANIFCTLTLPQSIGVTVFYPSAKCTRLLFGWHLQIISQTFITAIGVFLPLCASNKIYNGPRCCSLFHKKNAENNMLIAKAYSVGAERQKTCKAFAMFLMNSFKILGKYCAHSSALLIVKVFGWKNTSGF